MLLRYFPVWHQLPASRGDATEPFTSDCFHSDVATQMPLYRYSATPKSVILVCRKRIFHSRHIEAIQFSHQTQEYFTNQLVSVCTELKCHFVFLHNNVSSLHFLDISLVVSPTCRSRFPWYNRLLLFSFSLFGFDFRFMRSVYVLFKA